MHGIIEDFLADESIDWDIKTINWYRRRLTLFADYLAGQACGACGACGELSRTELSRAGVTRPEEITLRYVKRFLAEQRQAGLSWSTRNGTYTALGAFFRWLKASHLIAFDLFAEAGLKRPRKPRVVHRTIALRHIWRMIDAAKNSADLYGLRDGAMMRLLITTGLRRGELVRLDLADLDLVKGELIIVGKYNHQRAAFLDQATIRALRAWLVVRPDGDGVSERLFVSLRPGRRPAGAALEPNQVNRRLTYWRDVARIPGRIAVNPHLWRHTFASEFIAAGGDAFSLQQLLGHSDIKTTQIYVRLKKDQLRKKVALFGPKMRGT